MTRRKWRCWHGRDGPRRRVRGCRQRALLGRRPTRRCAGSRVTLGGLRATPTPLPGGHCFTLGFLRHAADEDVAGHDRARACSPFRLVTALWMWGKVARGSPGRPSSVAWVHRWFRLSGLRRLAPGRVPLLVGAGVSAPASNGAVLVHGPCRGARFYGAYAAKMPSGLRLARAAVPTHCRGSVPLVLTTFVRHVGCRRRTGFFTPFRAPPSPNVHSEGRCLSVPPLTRRGLLRGSALAAVSAVVGYVVARATAAAAGRGSRSLRGPTPYGPGSGPRRHTVLATVDANPARAARSSAGVPCSPRPARAEVHAVSATCTHEGCTVGRPQQTARSPVRGHGKRVPTQRPEAVLRGTGKTGPCPAVAVTVQGNQVVPGIGAHFRT